MKKSVSHETTEIQILDHFSKWYYLYKKREALRHVKVYMREDYNGKMILTDSVLFFYRLSWIHIKKCGTEICAFRSTILNNFAYTKRNLGEGKAEYNNEIYNFLSSYSRQVGKFIFPVFSTTSAMLMKKFILKITLSDEMYFST